MKKLISCILAVTTIATAAVGLTGCFGPDFDYYTYKVTEWKENPTDADYDEYGRGPRKLEYFTTSTVASFGKMPIANYYSNITGGFSSNDTATACVQNRWVDVEGTLYNSNGTTTEISEQGKEII